MSGIDTSQANAASETSGRPQIAKPQVSLVLSAMFLAYLAQMALNPIIAPLSREVGLAEWQVGATVSVSAIMVVVTSQFWGLRSQLWGTRLVLLTALAIAVPVMGLFALVSWLGMQGVLTGGALFLAFVLLRGVGWGSAIAAIPPTVQAYIAQATTTEAERIKGMAGVGAVQSLASIAGAVLGGMLAVFGLLTPILITPILLLVGLVALRVGLHRVPRQPLIRRPVRISVKDSRVWPYLVVGFGTFTAMGLTQIVIGFLVQDRLGIGPERTGLWAGIVMLVSGIATIFSQVVVVPRSGFSPPALLRVGGAITAAGFAVMLPDWGILGILGAAALIGIGLGVAIPGYVAGPTLFMSSHEQGGLAGLVSAVNGLTFVVAPTAGTLLYGWEPLAPIIMALVIMVAVTFFVLLHPRFHAVPRTVAGQN